MWGETWGTMIWESVFPVPTMGPLGWALLVGILMGVSLLLYRRPRSKPTTAIALVCVVTALSISVTALADEVVGLVTFTNGTVADADEVNGNFDAVKTAVDDNDSRTMNLEGQATALEAQVTVLEGEVVTLDSNKQDRVSGACPVGQYIRQVNADGTVVCAVDIDTDTNTNAGTLCANGAVLNGDGTCDVVDGSGTCASGSVCAGGHTHPGSEITSGTIDIGPGDYTHDARFGYIHINGVSLTPSIDGYTYTTSANGYIRPVSPSTSFFGHSAIDLPQGATITNVTIYTYDNSTDVSSQTWHCGIRRRPLGSASGVVVIERNLVINWAASSSIRSTSASGGTHVVDKVNNAYWLRAGVSGTDGSANFRYYGCRILYLYSDTNH